MSGCGGGLLGRDVAGQGTRLLSLPPPVSPSGPFSKTRASCLRREIGYGGGDVAAGGGCGGEFVEDAVWACTAG